MSRVRLSPWLIALAALSLLLGESAYLWAGLCCVLVHEWGHALCARALGLARAQRIASGTGIAVGLALMVLALFALHAVGKCNLTLLLCGGYVIFASGREMRGTPFSLSLIHI